MKQLDCLLIHVPKLHHFYSLIGDHMHCMSIAAGLFAIGDQMAKAGFL